MENGRIQTRKICVLGTFSVGKSSLIQRYLYNAFQEKYCTTVGVKIETKRILNYGIPIRLVIWDIYGEDLFQSIQQTHLRGSDGFLLVADGTRRETLDAALGIHKRIHPLHKETPVALLINKVDLARRWTVGPEDLEALRLAGWNILLTSAKGSVKVNQAFDDLLSKTLI